MLKKKAEKSLPLHSLFPYLELSPPACSYQSSSESPKPSPKPPSSMPQHPVACERCRASKQRCQVYDNDVSCHNCLRRGAQCSYIHSGPLQRGMPSATMSVPMPVYSGCRVCAYYGVHCSGGQPCSNCMNTNQHCAY
ncbi:hypothetical protein BDV98DRAFT_569810 [Pterulicium gracile]|uniref:Zn(2)-C6 fungal-type domain-containing protein n=1 Tax=Pterulicium gracile TaxID=1884261 RepID=A0A5C3QG34_9AGAR|nr:hypothetical protein BDV98DRAFT_569810 [Pterula gracilis]